MGKISTNVDLVKAGVRAVALAMVNNELLEECKGIIKKEGLFITLDSRGETHTSIYIFKHPCMENVIRFSIGLPHDKKSLIHWINGKMFGYADMEIDNFISQKMLLDEQRNKGKEMGD